LPAPVGVGVLSAAVGLLAFEWRRRPPPDARLIGPGSPVAVLAAVLAAAAAAGLAADARLASIRSGPLPALAAQRAVVAADLVVRSYPVERTDRPRGSERAETRVSLDAEVIRVMARGRTTEVHNPVLVRSADRGWLRLRPGQRVGTTGRLVEVPNRPATTALLLAEAGPRVESAPPASSRAAAAVRADLRRALAGLPADERGLLPGLLFGDTSGLDPRVTADFRAAGLSRLLAIDGAKLAILLAGVLGLARLVRVRRRVWPVLGVATLVGIETVVGPKPSLLRAGVMGAMAVLAPAVGRRSGATAGLSAAVVLLLLADPWLGRSYGFALSVVGTAGLLWLTPRWSRRLQRRLPRQIAGPLAVTAAAQAACGPVLVLMSGGVSLVAIPANLLAAVAVPPALLLGFAAGAIQPVSPPLAAFVARGAGACAWWIIAVARRAGELPGATLPWPGGVPGAVLLAVLTAVLIGLAHSGLPARLAPPGRSRARRALVALAALLAAVLVFRPNVPTPTSLGPMRWPPPGWQLVACDVGQGDALVLAAGGGSAVVVDTGPDPTAADRCLRSLGVHRVPYLLLTHFHADHVEGMPGVLRNRQVAEIGVSPLDEPVDEVQRVRLWARAAHVPITRARPGEMRAVLGWRWRVLWPLRLIREGSAPNNASVVLFVISPSGLRLLLTGDVETPAQAAIHRAEPGLRVDVLKTPHHGSTRQDPEFIRSLGARVAMTSVGLGNIYGHPAPWTLELLRNAGMVAGRTDRHGDLAAAVEGGRLRLVARKGPPTAAGVGSGPGEAGPVSPAGCLLGAEPLEAGRPLTRCPGVGRAR